MRFAPFFLIRSPLLDSSFESGDPVTALALPEVDEALRWASPSLATAVSNAARKSPESHLAAARYVSRMAGRATPFGLMAGYSAGRTYGDETVLRLAPRGSYFRVVRLDLDAVYRLVRKAAIDDPTHTRWTARRDLIAFPDTLRASVRSADSGAPLTTFDVTRSPALDALFRAAAEGASWADLVAAALSFGGASEDQARRFVQALIDNELLVAEQNPSIFIDDELLPLEAATSTQPVATRLRAIRSTPLAEDIDLPAVAHDLALDRADFIVDLVKPTDGEALLGRDVLRPLARVVAMLQRCEPLEIDGRMESFVNRFQERYEGREVSLVEALDSRRGLTFPASPEFTADPAAQKMADGWKLALFARARHGREPIELSEGDLLPRPFFELGETFHVRLMLARDPLQIWHPSVLARSPATLLFARSTAVLPSSFREAVVAHLAGAAARHRETDTVDVAYFVPGKSAAFSQYPPLQPLDIMLTAAGSGSRRTVDINDVLVSVRGGRPRLRSRVTGRALRVRPTSATTTSRGDVTDLFRFLYALASIERLYAEWNWGPLRDAPELPRVIYEGHVISPAFWNLSEEETSRVRKAKTPKERFAAVQSLRQLRQLPARVRYLEDGDHELPVNLDDETSVEAWLDIARERMVLAESPPVERSAVTGPEGTFHHEIIVPGTNFTAANLEAPSDSSPPVSTEITFDDVSPGGEVLYLRVFGDPDCLIELLVKLAKQLIYPAVERREVSHWFFLPFTTSGSELRIRLFGEPSALWDPRLLAGFRSIFEPLLQRRILREFDVATYQRETYRYGGPHGMSVAERLFHASSDIAVRLHGERDFFDDADFVPYLFVLVGTLRALVNATGAPLAAQLDIARLAATGYERSTDPRPARELASDLARRYRVELKAADHDSVNDRERSHLADLLAGSNFRREELLVPFARWMSDCLHVHTTRLLTTWHHRRDLEVVAYHLLAKRIAGEISTRRHAST